MYRSNPVRLQPLQALVDRHEDVASGETCPSERLAAAKTDFGCEDDLAAVRFECLAEELLRFTSGINVRGVEEIDPSVDGFAYELIRESRANLVDCANILVALGEGHGAEGHTRNDQSGATEHGVLHLGLLAYFPLRSSGRRSWRCHQKN